MARMPHQDGSITMQWGKGKGTGGVTDGGKDGDKGKEWQANKKTAKVKGRVIT